MRELPVLGGVFRVVGRKPVQAGKFIGIIIALVFGVAGFLRLIDFTTLMGDPRLGDGQLLVLLVLPLLSLSLVVIVFLETLWDGYRFYRSNMGISEHISGRWGYVLLRGVEAVIAVVGVGIMISVIPVLFSASTPAPIGVGAMLLLGLVAVLILFASFVRAGAELFVYSSA